MTFTRSAPPRCPAVNWSSRLAIRAPAASAEQECSIGARVAGRRDHLLEPPEGLTATKKILAIYGLRSAGGPRRKEALIRGLSYRIETRKLAEQSFFMPLLTEREIIVV